MAGDTLQRALDLPLAARVMARAGVAAEPVAFVSRHEGAKGAVFLLGTREGVIVAVKIYAREHAERMEKEARLYELAQGTQVALPRMLGFNEFDEELGAAVLVMSALDGVPLMSLLYRLSEDELLMLYRQIGVMQHQLHGVLCDRFSLLIIGVSEGHADNVGLMRERTTAALAEFKQHGGDPKLGERLKQYFVECEPLFARCTQAVLCHNDFHEQNVMVDRTLGEARITGLIDFENALAADPIFDLAKTQNHARRGSERTLNALIDGYGEMPEGWREPFDAYIVFHALELRNWYAAGAAFAPLHPLERKIRRLVGVPTVLDRVAGMFGRD